MTSDTSVERSARTTPDAARDSPGGGANVRHDATATALIHAAHDLLAGDGPGALTVRRIASAAGVSTMNVYSRFGGKDGVIEQLFIDGFTRLGGAVGECAGTGDAMADLRECGEAYRRFARENSTYYSLMFGAAIPEFRPSEEAMAIALGALARVVTLVRHAVDVGGISAEHDPGVVAAALWSCQHGLVSLELGMHGEKDDLFDWDAITAMTLDALLRGLA